LNDQKPLPQIVAVFVKEQTLWDSSADVAIISVVMQRSLPNPLREERKAARNKNDVDKYMSFVFRIE